MRYLLAIVALLIPMTAFAASDYFIKIDGVEGESKTSAPTTTKAPAARAGTDASVQPAGTPGSTENTGVEPDEIDVSATDSEAKKGNVEYNWKVEEGESAEANKPDDIDSGDGSDPQPVTPDFGILLGGGSESEESEAGRTEAARILHEGMQTTDTPTESISLNYEKIKARVRHQVKLLGFIPLNATATVEIDAEQKVSVKFPWWTFFASGKDGQNLGERVFTSLSNVLKSKHDTLKNAIGNIR